MNTNWSKILLFILLSFALGFLVAHCCMRHCGHRGGCGGERGCEMREGCEHGGMKGDCCKGGHEGCEHGEMKGGKCCTMDMHGNDKVHTICEGLEAKNFQGDTTIKVEGGTVDISRHGDKMEVKVQMTDSVKKEVEVEVH